MQLRGCRLLIRCIRIKRLCTHFVISRQGSIPPSPGHHQILQDRKGRGKKHTNKISNTPCQDVNSFSFGFSWTYQDGANRTLFFSSVFCKWTVRLNCGVKCSLISYEMSEWKFLYDLNVTKHLWQKQKHKHNLWCKEWKACGKSSQDKR